jgi:translation elongation factor EF-1beta
MDAMTDDPIAFGLKLGTTIMKMKLKEKMSEKRIRELENLMDELLNYLDDISDVEDGPNGPEPNRAMALCVMIREVVP